MDLPSGIGGPTNGAVLPSAGRGRLAGRALYPTRDRGRLALLPCKGTFVSLHKGRDQPPYGLLVSASAK